MADEQASTPKKEPTTAEAMFFFAIVKHTKNKADIDWSAVAEEQNFKNAEVAKVRFGQIKRKLGISTTDSPASAGGATTSTRATPKKATTPKKAATPKKTAGPATPSKVLKNTGRTGAKGRGGARASAVKKEEPNKDATDAAKDDDDDATVVGGKPAAVKSETYEGTPSQFEEELKSIMRSREAAAAEAEDETEDPF
ncbi:hypothetical protein JDV02_006181 [Purpureocillium takamizusanense]|uniref:Myb-like DNA-binding domain-containing protein n=1 Tax=Purpureocillium takamizusanense TaxID=2060973 RepID=A0A9Q8QHW3_9HYPO|nr:uncharacterized protein JDV02_006181 [Purpureocillium takamizusanense]UNI20053.1 hypothetical protein JDV02_006181 [Purpureocillium takamizusanense]